LSSPSLLYNTCTFSSFPCISPSLLHNVIPPPTSWKGHYQAFFHRPMYGSLIWLLIFWVWLSSPLIIRQRIEIQYHMIWLSSHLTLSFHNQW
jgi:hypothetical protein